MIRAQGSQLNDSLVGGSPLFVFSFTKAGAASCEHPSVEHAPFSAQQDKWWVSLQRGQVTTLSPAFNSTPQAGQWIEAPFSASKVHMRSWMVSGIKTPSLRSNLLLCIRKFSISLAAGQDKQARSGLAGLFYLMTLIMLLLLPAVAAANPLTTASIIDNMNNAMRQPVVMQYKQEAYARGLLGIYRWSSTIKLDGSDIKVDTQNAPSFVSAEMMRDISDFRKAMIAYNLEYTGTTKWDGKEYLTLKGLRKPEVTSGAIEATILIDPVTYLITRIEARYSWGKMTLDQMFIHKDGVAFLEKQEGSLSPWLMRITVTYSDYKF
jgi:hypothetical protein